MRLCDFCVTVSVYLLVYYEPIFFLPPSLFHRAQTGMPAEEQGGGQVLVRK